MHGIERNTPAKTANELSQSPNTSRYLFDNGKSPLARHLAKN